jgi:hypothetical protein
MQDFMSGSGTGLLLTLSRDMRFLDDNDHLESPDLPEPFESLDLAVLFVPFESFVFPDSSLESVDRYLAGDIDSTAFPLEPSEFSNISMAK